MPRDCHVAELIVRHVHQWESRHCGREHVLAKVQQRYWIPRGRQLVRKILKTCVLCKRLRGGLEGQQMADLPIDRVQPNVPPFTYTGVDCFGPFLVKRGRAVEKRYGCLFTCLTMRAIHIERLHSLDSDSFVNALIRFVARRGCPKKIRSDNGTNFVGGNKELRQSIDEWNSSNKLRQELLIRQIEWQFNPPTASHMGGAWERQIRTVRKVMNAILRNQVLDDERLDTIFAEVENIVNSRPLTVVSSDPNDMDPLTPNMLLRPGGETISSPPGHFTSEDSYGRRWRHVQHVVNTFWKRWISEYLPTIRDRSKWAEKRRNLRIGDVVLIADHTLPRGCWPLGRVTDVFPDRKGLVRSVQLRTGQSGVLVRPVHKLCLLEGSE